MDRLMRLLHWVYAHINGYFWLPCPMCGRKFGGHESTGGIIMTSWGYGKMVCPKCDVAAYEYNKKWIAANPHPGIECHRLF